MLHWYCPEESRAARGRFQRFAEHTHSRMRHERRWSHPPNDRPARRDSANEPTALHPASTVRQEVNRRGIATHRRLHRALDQCSPTDSAPCAHWPSPRIRRHAIWHTQPHHTACLRMASCHPCSDRRHLNGEQSGTSTGAYITARVPIITFTCPNATAKYARYRSAAGIWAFNTATSPIQLPEGVGERFEPIVAQHWKQILDFLMVGCSPRTRFAGAGAVATIHAIFRCHSGLRTASRKQRIGTVARAGHHSAHWLRHNWRQCADRLVRRPLIPNRPPQTRNRMGGCHPAGAAAGKPSLYVIRQRATDRSSERQSTAAGFPP